MESGPYMSGSSIVQNDTNENLSNEQLSMIIKGLKLKEKELDNSKFPPLAYESDAFKRLQGWKKYKGVNPGINSVW